MKYYLLLFILIILTGCAKHRSIYNFEVSRYIDNRDLHWDYTSNNDTNKVDFIKLTLTRFLNVDLLLKYMNKKDPFKNIKNPNEKIYLNSYVYRELLQLIPPPACPIEMQVESVQFDVNPLFFDSTFDFNFYLVKIKTRVWDGEYISFSCNENYSTPPFKKNAPENNYSIGSSENYLIQELINGQYLIALATDNKFSKEGFWKDKFYRYTQRPMSLLIKDNQSRTTFMIFSEKTGYNEISKLNLLRCFNINQITPISNEEGDTKKLSLQIRADKPEKLLPYLNIVLHADYLPEKFEFIKSDKKNFYFEFYSKVHEKKVSIKVNANYPNLFKIKFL